MGNSDSKSSRLKIYIETEKPFFNSGSTIEGVVFIEALDQFNMDALFIRIQGDQQCQWFEGSSKNRRKYTGSENFYVQEHILKKYASNILQKGKYIYPFSIQLSENIPGSFSSGEHDAKIQYKLIVYFANFTNSKFTQLQSIPLTIREPFRMQFMPFHGQDLTNPSICGCFNQGEVGLYVWFEKNVCFEGQPIKIQGKINNTNGKTDIKKVNVELVQYTFVSANNGVFRTYRKVEHKHIIYLKAQKGRQQQFQYKLVIPNVAHQTAISTLVANYYRFQISIDMGLLVSQKPSVISPIFILKKNFKLKQKQLKINFNEQNSKKQKIQFFKAPQYWFRKNRNLDIMNFRISDIVSQSD